MGKRLYESDPASLGGSKSARMLATIRRDMDLKDALMRKRRRNEEILSLSYCDSVSIGGADEAANLRENALNLPYRYVRWLESQATSKRMVVKVNRDAGEGQRPGGPADNQTGMWTGITLGRVAYEAGFKPEIKAVIGEVCPRGTSVMRIGYHRTAITLNESAEVGKDAQSVVADVLAKGDVEAKDGQSHPEISKGLANMVEDPLVQAQVGRDGVAAIVARKDSHDVAAYNAESKSIPMQDVRPIRHKVWMRKLRVGEDCGWSPDVFDVRDARFWWARNVWTVAEVTASPLFSEKFKADLKARRIEGYDGRNISGVARGGQTVSTESMGSDARQAQSEDVLDADERLVEWFEVWCGLPDTQSGGVRKIVTALCPEEFVEADESNPHVYPEGHPQAGYGCIPGFYPFYDFTPVLPPLTVPERTCGIPPVSVGMPQFEQIRECNRLLHESALRHSLRFYDVHPAHKDNKKLLDALKNGEDGYAQVMTQAQRDTASGKLEPSIVPIQFSGNTLEVERLAQRAENAWIKVMGMPPAIINGVGTAETATQDQQGIAAGERESGALVASFEERMGDVLAGIRGLIRANYDDEDFVALLGEEGAKVMKAWQYATTDDGDSISVTFGANAQAQETVEKKQLMEAITLEKGEIEPVTGLEKYDTAPLFEELHRRLDVGPPMQNASVLKQLQQAVIVLSQQVQQLTGGLGQNGASSGAKPQGGDAPRAGPNPSEGNGPSQGTLSAGAVRGTVEPQVAG